MKKLLLFAALLLLPALALAETYYYNPDGGAKYHLDPACPSISSKYHGSMQPVDSAELASAPYSLLKPCSFCGTPAHETPPPLRISPYTAEMEQALLRTQGIGITGAGQFRIGNALPEGPYTLHCHEGTEILVEGAAGTRRIGPGGYQSLWLHKGDLVTLPELATMDGMHTTWLFQETKPYPITHGRFLAYVNMPGRQYTITADSDDAYVDIASCDESRHVRIALRKGQSIILDLQPENLDQPWPGAWYADSHQAITLWQDAFPHVFVEISRCTLTFQQGLG